MLACTQPLSRAMNFEDDGCRRSLGASSREQTSLGLADEDEDLDAAIDLYASLRNGCY